MILKAFRKKKFVIKIGLGIICVGTISIIAYYYKHDNFLIYYGIFLWIFGLVLIDLFDDNPNPDDKDVEELGKK